MKFIKVDHSLNQTYRVEDGAIKSMIEKVFKKTDGIKLLKIDVKINKAINGYSATIEATKKADASYYKLITQIESDIKYYSLNLINTGPDNIQIFFKEQ